MKSISFYLWAKMSQNPFDLDPNGEMVTSHFPALWLPVLISSLTFTLLFTFFRQLMIRSLLAITSVNQFKQLTKEMHAKGTLDFILPLVFAVYALSIFNKILFPIWSVYQIFMVLFLGIVVKVFAVQSVGSLFGLKKPSHYYSSTVLIIYLAIGTILVPINLFLIFSTGTVQQILLTTGISFSIFLFFIRYLRAAQVNFRLVSHNKFHFLLYICTLEIGPFLVIYKLIFNQLTL